MAVWKGLTRWPTGEGPPVQVSVRASTWRSMLTPLVPTMPCFGQAPPFLWKLQVEASVRVQIKKNVVFNIISDIKVF